ncbi:MULTISPECIES: HopJ type III effector protein [Vibrio]|uniref:Type III effector n=1 Tax=Vibrio algicola TaxID=2662262 RepID=A0A5Q0TJJ8_9VIBR|nr:MULTISPECIES: HopJ type III effector protein [Vibrio]MBD1575294.1 HopJ type III effector protein [Vibrio sp. S11_S32]
MELTEFVHQVTTEPLSVEFEQTISVIDGNFTFTPTAFKNGEVENDAGQNNGSCKIFAFAQMHNLTEAQTLACFGKFYRQDVLEHPENEDHQNIRNFITHGWAGIEFAAPALK